MTDEFHEQWAEVNDGIGLFDDVVDPPAWRPDELAFEVHCPPGVLDRKIAALLADRSQTAPLVALFGADRYRRWWATESFVDATRVLDGAPDARPAADFVRI